MEMEFVEKPSGFSFKTLVVALTMAAAVALCGFSVLTGDYTLFDKVVGAVVEVAKAAVKQ